jgi:hypothetical protein
MEMPVFDLSLPKLLVLAVLALIMFGPMNCRSSPLRPCPKQGRQQPDDDAVPDRTAGNGQDPRGRTSPAS